MDNNVIKEKSCGLIIFKNELDKLMVLMEKQVEGHWSLPKGHVEDGETVASTDLLVPGIGEIIGASQREGIDYFTFYYAGDNLDSVEWDERSLAGMVNIDKKKKVMTLALELALEMSKI